MKPKYDGLKYDGLLLASYWRRGAALFIDFAIILFADSLVASLFAWRSSGIVLALALVYFWYCWTRRNGRSLGQQFMKLRVIKRDGSAISDADALLRAFLLYFGLALLVGLLWALFDDLNQAWHDKAAGTIVIDERHGSLAPDNAPRRRPRPR